MKKLYTIIGDSDVNYLEMLTSYLRNSVYGEQISFKLFSQQDKLAHYLSDNPLFHLMIVSPTLLPKEWKKPPNRTVIFLEDDLVTKKEDVQRTDIPSVYKYQPLNQLMSRFLTIYYEQNGNKGISRGDRNKDTYVISIYSTVGGVGKTTVAINLARQLVQQHHRVFYLSLGLFNPTLLFFTSLDQSPPSSEALYHIKTDPNQFLTRLESIKKHDPYIKADYFPLPLNPKDMLELTENETTALIQGLIEADRYDYIVIDLDHLLNDRIRAAFQGSNIIYWLLNSDVQSFYTTSAMIKELPTYLADDFAADKVSFILNRYTGRMASELAKYNLEVRHHLPYIPEWKTVSTSKQLISSPTFEHGIHKLIENLEEQRRGVLID